MSKILKIGTAVFLVCAASVIQNDNASALLFVLAALFFYINALRND